VKWEDSENNTWEKRENLKGCEELINQIEE
jgi:hypothetical protein